jgi:hypothetical protein
MYERLNVGCGPVQLLGYLNMDIESQAYVHGARFQRCDVRSGLPLGAGQAVEVRADQFIEHLTLPELAAFVCEAHRVLTPGGELRLSFPDVRAIAELAGRGELDYVARNEGLEDGSGMPLGLALLNYCVTAWGHKSILTLETVLPMVRERFEVIWHCVQVTNALIIARR